MRSCLTGINEFLGIVNPLHDVVIDGNLSIVYPLGSYIV